MLALGCRSRDPVEIYCLPVATNVWTEIAAAKRKYFYVANTKMLPLMLQHRYRRPSMRSRSLASGLGRGLGLAQRSLLPPASCHHHSTQLAQHVVCASTAAID